MKKLGIFALVITLLSIGSIAKDQNKTITHNTSLSGPSSVAAINTSFRTQEHLDAVFGKWLIKFEHESNYCETLLTDIETVPYPNLYEAEIIEVEFKVLNKCENKIYTHQASFELVILDTDLMA